jgi:hypothetical protein
MYVIGTTRSMAVIGHGAAGVEVGEDDSLMWTGQHVGRLRHEVDAAEHDVGRDLVVGGEAGEQERVADGVSPANHLVPLVVVTEDHQPVAKRLLGRRDAVDEVVVGREGDVIRERSLETQHVGPPPFRGYSSSAGGWQPGRQHRGVVGLGALMETPDTGPA